MSSNVRIGLGTVELGLPYGKNQHQPLMSKKNAFDILKLATSHGIDFFDTAPNYGESEARIGEFAASNKTCHFEISTKLPKVGKEIWSSEEKFLSFAKNSISSSKDMLQQNKIDLIQLHQCDPDFLTSKAVANVLSILLNENICSKIGVSIYDEEQAELALNIPSVSALQIPINILDNRFIAKKMRALFLEKKPLLIGRSILFQGLLCTSYEPPNVKKKNLLSELRRTIEADIDSKEIQRIAFGFGFGTLSDFLNIALIGVDSCTELTENLLLIQTKKKITQSELDLFRAAREFAAEYDLINPSNWLI